MMEVLLGDQETALSTLSNRAAELCSISSLISATESHKRFVADLLQTKRVIGDLDSAYNQMKSMSVQLLKASEDEALSAARIQNELDALMQTAARIDDELKYIEEERERLAFKAATGDNICPLPDLLDAGTGYYNPTWLKLYNRGNLESTYN